MNKKKFLGVLVLIIGTLVLFWGWGEYSYRYAGAVRNNGVVQVGTGESLQSVAHKLQSEGVISSADDFVSDAKKHEIGDIKPGNYSFSKGETLRQMFVRLRGGHQTPVRVTFNNIRTLEQLAGVLGRQMMADSLEFLRSFPKGERGFIGKFIPNTYEVWWTETPEKFTERMQREYDKFWSDTKRQKLAKQLGYTPQQIITIASIVDEETNAQSEMTDVAGVYINRLRIGMLLQADPTAKYAVGDFTLKRILNVHLKHPSPYNTYVHKGLPPGPICAPSIAAIDATLQYANKKHKYLYFCANSDFSGRHAFAENLQQHNENARKYHRELNRRGIK